MQPPSPEHAHDHLPLAAAADGRARAIRRVLWLALVLNITAAVAKFLVGRFLVQSASMVAESYHSLLDGLGSAIGLVAMRYAARPPDRGHPYGHAKHEVVAAMAIGLLLFAAAYEIVSNAIARWGGGTKIHYHLEAVILVTATILVSGWLSWYERRRGRALGSPVLLSDSAHTLTDVFASIAVLVALIAARLGWPQLDLIIAVGIAVLIGWTGFRIIRGGLAVMTDATVIAPGQIEGLVESIPEVREAHRIRSRSAGARTFVDLHVLVDPGMSVREAHDLSTRIEELIRERILPSADITTHVEPAGEDTARERGTSSPPGSAERKEPGE